jgi:phosphoglycolate phosphatase-like HAD superfamily hydrolase
MSIKKILNSFDTIFWDFDGVIKDSVTIKNVAFERLFSDFDDEIVSQIKKHHKENIGLSRFEKIPIYLTLAGELASNQKVMEYCENFSSLVKLSVINSGWVPGVLNYLDLNFKKKNFFIITGTPQNEIEEILNELTINSYFIKVYGSPITKVKAISDVMQKFKIKQDSAIMIGDSLIDYEAADENNIFFALKQTEFNLHLQNSLDCFRFKDFTDE